MNRHDANIPDDLKQINQLLDALGTAERTVPGLEQRIFDSTQPIFADESTGSLDALGHAERAAASVSLEDRIFIATRSIINDARQNTPAVNTSSVLAGDAADQPINFTKARTSIRLRTWLAPLALAAGLTLAVTAAFMFTGNNSGASQIERDIAMIDANLANIDAALQLTSSFLEQPQLSNLFSDTAAFGTSNTDSIDDLGTFTGEDAL